MKNVFIITALVLTFACTKKTDDAAMTDEGTATTTENVETAPNNDGEAQVGVAPANGEAVRDSNQELVKDKDGKIVRETQSSSSSN